MSKKFRLRAPVGTDEANYSGAERPYKVAPDGTVEVDEGAVAGLVGAGGFSLIEEEPAVELGKVKLVNADDPTAGVSFGGVSYQPDEDGIVTVPAEAAADLVSHGFVPVAELVKELTETVVPSVAEEKAAEPPKAPEAAKPVEAPKPSEAPKADAKPAADAKKA